MKRRDFIKYSSINTIFLGQNLFASTNENMDLFAFFKKLFEDEEKKEELKKAIQDKKEIVVSTKPEDEVKDLEHVEEIDESSVVKDAIAPERKEIVHTDVILNDKYLTSATTVRKKLHAIQKYVGYGNFNIISFDEMLNIPKYTSIESFSKEELEFLEYIFYYDPKYHGFYGKRVSKNITDTIDKNRVIKVPNTGHYLFQDGPYDTYKRMCDDIGDTLVLTSGIRSVVKQTKLFLDKLHRENGNMSLTSKSLAPPAFTYHTIADFDVGKKGFGYANFTSRFALTQEFFKMKRLDYIDIRYTVKNLDGVRYEPWHVKVI